MLKEKLKSNKFILEKYKKYIEKKIDILSVVSPKSASKYLYKKVFGKKLNLKKPTTFNEKIMWLKLNTYYKNNKITDCVDKVKVKEFIKEKGYEKIVVPNIAIYNNTKEIQWDELPNSFVLKCNFGCGYNIICKNKSKLSETETKKTLEKWMKEEFYTKNAEVQYKYVDKKILCEKFLGEDIKDYKFFCFNGEPKFLYVSSGLGEHDNPKIGYYDLQLNELNIKRDGYEILKKEELEIPKNFEEMIEISKGLSSEFPFVRVDLYSINDRVYFSELTFVPTGGVMKIQPERYDKLWGELLNIEEFKGK